LPELWEAIARRLKCGNSEIRNWRENFSHENTIKEKTYEHYRNKSSGA
jgi:hypothetical protein